jgi:hypothetical protein
MPTARTERKRKRATAGGWKKQPREANETTGKWLASMASFEELQLFMEEKSMLVDLEHRNPEGEVLPSPCDGEHMIHEEYFGRGLGFPLHSFMRGLLRF